MSESTILDASKKYAVRFHKWMMDNDTPENAERFANFSDEDMFDEFIREQGYVTLD